MRFVASFLQLLDLPSRAMSGWKVNASLCQGLLMFRLSLDIVATLRLDALLTNVDLGAHWGGSSCFEGIIKHLHVGGLLPG